MTLPTRNRRGFRPIVVRDLTCRWRLRPGAHHSTLTVIGPDPPAQRLLITLTAWRDPWLNLSGFQILPDETLQLYTHARNDPSRITPAFVAHLIEHALDTGWQPHTRGPDHPMTFPPDADASPTP